MKVTVDSLYCPMTPLLWAKAPGGRSHASRIHKAYARAMWRDRGAFGRMALLARFAAWPAVVLGCVGYFTWHNGITIRRRAGRGVFAQIADQLVLAARYGILPPWYYMFELFRDENRARAGDYLHRYETKRALYGLVKRFENPPELKQFYNKALFDEVCGRSNLPTPPQVAVVEGGRIRRRWSADADAEGVTSLPEADLFIKPMMGKGGRGTLHALYIGEGRYRTADATERTADEMISFLCDLSRDRPYVVQHRLFNHHDIIDLCANALSCARILTIRNRSGGFEMVHAAFRMAMREDAPVDGLHMGGLVSRIDVETGRLGPATDLGFFARVGWCDDHPHTGRRIAGRELPMWAETRALVVRAHSVFPYKTAVGWDIAITADGPVIVEGNSSPCVDINQRVDGPLGSSRFGELFAHHVSHAEELTRAARAHGA